MDLEEVGGDGVYGNMAGCYERGDESSGIIECGEFLHYVRKERILPCG
jgi:hypothetical protein